MTDQKTPDEATPRSETVVDLVTDGAYSLIVARFPTTDKAEDAYRMLTELERREQPADRRRRRRQPRCGRQGPPQQVTEHSTRTGLRWGLVGGVALGLVFPPSILAGAVAGGGALGAAIGEVGNLSKQIGPVEGARGVLTPGSSGVIALVEDTAVVEIQKALAEADAIVTKAVDKQLAAAIDREAALAKESLGTWGPGRRARVLIEPGRTMNEVPDREHRRRGRLAHTLTPQTALEPKGVSPEHGLTNAQAEGAPSQRVARRSSTLSSWAAWPSPACPTGRGSVSCGRCSSSHAILTLVVLTGCYQ